MMDALLAVFHFNLKLYCGNWCNALLASLRNNNIFVSIYSSRFLFASLIHPTNTIVLGSIESANQMAKKKNRWSKKKTTQRVVWCCDMCVYRRWCSVRITECARANTHKHANDDDVARIFSKFLQHLCWIQFYYDCIRCLTSGLDVTIFFGAAANTLDADTPSHKWIFLPSVEEILVCIFI